MYDVVWRRGYSIEPSHDQVVLRRGLPTLESAILREIRLGGA